MRTATTILAVTCVGCGGPSPSEPAQATTLFALELQPLQTDDQDCKVGSFIGNVALGASQGYAITHAFFPGCSGGNNPDAVIDAQVYKFNKQQAGTQMPIGQAGKTKPGGDQGSLF